MRISLLESLQPGKLDELRNPVTDRVFVCFFHLKPKGNILIHGHVLKERIVLEHKADFPLLGRKRINRFAMKNNFTAIRRLQSCQHAQNRGFAAAAWA
ncbi:hypothetical protein D3C80_1144840 [compost metagenome]